MEYKISLIDLLDDDIKKKLVKLQEEHKEIVEGIYDLYDSLYINGYCNSSKKSRILYVGYTLATIDIDFKIEV